ncbi:MAG: outer membrane lipoprotein carrier protein LolA [Bdellovibrionales bacterium]
MRLVVLMMSGLISSVPGPLVLAGESAKAATKKINSNSVKKEIEQALKPMRQKEGTSVAIKKRTTNSLLGREKKSEGRLYYRRGKLRLELKSPEDSLVILDGKTLWLATKLDEDLGGKTMVTKTSARSLKKSSTLIAALLENQQLLKEFKVSARKTDGEEVHLKFTPRLSDGEIQDLQLWLNPKAGRLLKVLYTDDKENEVEFTLGEPGSLFSGFDSDPDQIFFYKPPKDAEVTEF